MPTLNGQGCSFAQGNLGSATSIGLAGQEFAISYGEITTSGGLVIRPEPDYEIAAYTVNGSVVVTDWLQSAFIHMATDQQPVSDRAEEVFCNNRVATGVLMAEVDSCVVQPKRIH